MISIIIPTHHRWQQLALLLKSLANQTLAKQDFEVIVVSNLPDHHTAKCIRDFSTSIPNLRYFELGHLGVNRARNSGINRAKGDILLFLDDDCYVTNNNYLCELLDYHKRFPQVAGIGGIYALHSTATLLEQVYHYIAMTWLKNAIIEGNYTTSLIGGHASYKRLVFDAGLRFDERLAYGGTEVGFNANLVLRGYELLLLPELTVVHDLSLNFMEFTQKAFKQGCGLAHNQEWGRLVNLMRNQSKFGQNMQLTFTESLLYNWYAQLFHAGFFWHTHQKMHTASLYIVFKYLNEKLRYLHIKVLNSRLLLDLYYAVRFRSSRGNTVNRN